MRCLAAHSVYIPYDLNVDAWIQNKTSIEMFRRTSNGCQVQLPLRNMRHQTSIYQLKKINDSFYWHGLTLIPAWISNLVSGMASSGNHHGLSFETCSAQGPPLFQGSLYHMLATGPLLCYPSIWWTASFDPRWKGVEARAQRRPNPFPLPKMHVLHII